MPLMFCVLVFFLRRHTRSRRIGRLGASWPKNLLAVTDIYVSRDRWTRNHVHVLFSVFVYVGARGVCRGAAAGAGHRARGGRRIHRAARGVARRRRCERRCERRFERRRCEQRRCERRRCQQCRCERRRCERRRVGGLSAPAPAGRGPRPLQQG